MFKDARKVPDGTTIECDICVVGAGFAGIGLALELDGTSLDVIVLESGGTLLNKRTQDLYRGKSLNPSHGALHLYRQRRFGGTSSVWGGRSAPYDNLDFEERPQVPLSGWPVDRIEMDPYYERAFQWLDLGTYGETVGGLLPSDRREMIPGFSSSMVETDRLWLFSLPTKLGRKYRRPMERSSNVTTYLHGNCVDIVGDVDGKSVKHLDVATLDDTRFRLKAQHYVLAMGGLEVARLLLAANSRAAVPLGRGRDNIGRYYISHVTGNAGEVQFEPSAGLRWDLEKTIDGVYCRHSLRIEDGVQGDRALLNFRATLDNPNPADPRHGNPVLSMMYLLKRFLVRRIPPEYSRELSGASPSTHLWHHVKNCIVGLPRLSAFSWKWLAKRILARRKLPSIMLENRQGIYNLHFDAEQMPNPDSCVYLGPETDELGLPRLVVDWKLSDQDVQSVVESAKIVAQELERTGTGRMEVDEAALAGSVRRSGVGSHHFGLTRMSVDPSTGVVDRDCRVFGVDNLYIASPSTFPTSGVTNPALGTMAFSIRLADHLKQIEANNEGGTIA
jgi:hypothetical protein